MTGTTWTDADQAEAEVLVHALGVAYMEHRERCAACRPEPCPELEAWLAHRPACPVCGSDAPLRVHGGRMTLWVRCAAKDALVKHNRTCARCNPCPHLQAAISEVVEWLEARVLLSRAQALRRALDELDELDPEPVVPKVAA